MASELIYKMFKEGDSPERWHCTLCSLTIQINPELYYKLNAGRRRDALQTEADKHAEKHPDYKG